MRDSGWVKRGGGWFFRSFLWAVGKLPVARPDDAAVHETESHNPSGAIDPPKIAAVRVHQQGSGDDGADDGHEAERECKFRPAPCAGALCSADAGNGHDED